MHRLWRVLIIGIVCLALLSPALAEARARYVFEAHSKIDNSETQATSAKIELNVLIVTLPWGGYLGICVLKTKPSDGSVESGAVGSQPKKEGSPDVR